MDVGFDVVGLATMGIAKWAKTGSPIARDTADIGRLSNQMQIVKHTAEIFDGTGGWVSVGIDIAGAAPWPAVSIPANVYSLITDLKPGIKIVWR